MLSLSSNSSVSVESNPEIYSVMDALSGPLQGCKFVCKEKGVMEIQVSCLCLHFRDEACIEVCGKFKLRLMHETPAYMPETDRLRLAQIVTAAAFDAQFEVEDNPGFILGLYELVRITCATTIIGVCLSLWSCPAGTLATRGFKVLNCLERTPRFCSSNLDSFLQSQLGNVMKFQLPLPFHRSFTFVDDKWRLSLCQDLSINQ